MAILENHIRQTDRRGDGADRQMGQIGYMGQIHRWDRQDIWDKQNIWDRYDRWDRWDKRGRSTDGADRIYGTQIGYIDIQTDGTDNIDGTDGTDGVDRSFIKLP